MKKLFPIAVVFIAVLAGVAAAQDYAISTVIDSSSQAVNPLETAWRWPSGITVDRAGNLYFVEWGRHAVRKISTEGFVTTFAGSPESSGSADGNGTEARFS